MASLLIQEGRRISAGGWLPGVVTRHRLTRAPLPPQASTQARYVVKRKIGQFPTGGKEFYKSRRRFPTRSKCVCDARRRGGQDVTVAGTPDTTVVRPYDQVVGAHGHAPLRPAYEMAAD
jgi:hypothetical protein